MNGTITVRRPRMRNTEERFESKIIPFFKRRSKEVGQLLPELYLHGLAMGDFDLSLRGLLGDGAPLSASSIARLKAKWQLEYEQWKTQDIVESPFSSVRLRTNAAKRFKKVQNATAMIWKLLLVAEKSFRKLKGHRLLSDVYSGKTFVNGVIKQGSRVSERIAA